MIAPHRITIRDATAGDVATIAAYNQRLALESEGRSLDDAILNAGVARGLAHLELCRYFIAMVDGRVVGTTMVTYEVTDWRNGLLWWLQSVYVEPEYRRLGVFRAIYRHIEALARAHPDVRGLRLYVHRDNARAMKTYDAVGMTNAGYEVYEHDWSGSVHSVEDE